MWKDMSSLIQMFSLGLQPPFWLSLVPLFLVLFIIKRFFTTSTKNLPPSPPKLPIIGNTHQLGKYPHHSLRAMARKHGPLMLVHFGSRPTLIVSSSEAACEIMKTQDLVFANRPTSMISKKLLYDDMDVATAPYGEYWRQMKSILVLRVLSNKRVQSTRKVREDETALLVKKIKESENSSVDLSDMFMRLTNDVVCLAALGRKYSGGDSGKKFKKLLSEFMELLGTVVVGDFIPWIGWISDRITGLEAKVDRVAREMDEFLEGVVKEHVDRSRKITKSGDDGGRVEDFVDVLLGIYEENNKMGGVSMHRDSIKALIMDIFVAGTDTTYTVLEWVMTELLRHPQAMKEVQNEVRGIVSNKESIADEDLEKMHYLKAVIKETLRLHPPIPLLVPRESSQDRKVMGYDISAGTMIITNALAIGRDPNSWDEPEEFRPERFLNSSIDFKGHDFELIPFGAGRRGCPGISFAMATNELVLANILQKFDWALPGGAKVDDLEMTESTGLTIHRKVPLLAVATPFPYYLG